MLAWVMNLNFRGSSILVTIPVKTFISLEADMTHTSKEADQTHISLEHDQKKDDPRC